jgi:phosphoribosylamine--glycine ligase
MKVLVIGGGGREHALAWKLADSRHVDDLYVAPGNAGTAQVADNVPIKDTDTDSLLKFARDKKIDLTVVGPEDPLALGLADVFEKAGQKVFGPSAAAARLEGDKAFAKELMRQHAIPTADSRTFSDYQAARQYIAARDVPLVVKATGLAKGKGVIVCHDSAEAIRAAEKMMVEGIFGDAGRQIVVEERLYGPEASILAFVDGQTIYPMEAAQDHKPIGDGDTGPNTGGMGAYSPTPIVTAELMRQVEGQILVPVVHAMYRAGTPYKGVLYVGLMLTAAGPKVLEFNCRFGDPEAQPIVARLKSDLFEAMMATAEGRLDHITLKWDKRPGVCVVLASGGYPDKYETGKEITGLAEAGALADTWVFHAGTKLQAGKVVTAGGRVLGVTAVGKTIAAARKRAYEAVEKIHFEGMYYRKDIAAKSINT